jgi:FkbM family methyltransferase
VRSLERLSVQLRHAAWFDQADWLWALLRPPYNRIIDVYARNGLERVINGTDVLRLLPAWRGIAERYEPEVWRKLMDEVRPGDVIADVGAYVGLYTVALALRAGRTGHVVAFEPDLQSAVAVRGHCALNRVLERVDVREVAIGDVDGDVAFESGRGSESSISASVRTATRVPSARLDTVFPSGKLDILKIDIEGYEEGALRGAERLLRDVIRRPRAIFIEVHPYAWAAAGTTSESLLEFLRSCNYLVFDLSGRPVQQLTTYGEVVARPCHPEATGVA